jgi:hypothetical protein
MADEGPKTELVALRLTKDEMALLDGMTTGGLSRAHILRLLIQDFLGKSEKERREFITDRLFRS